MPKVKRSRPVRKSRKDGVPVEVPVVDGVKVEVPVEVPVEVEEVKVEDDTVSIATTTTSTASRKRRKYTREDVERAFDGYFELLNEQLELTRSDKKPQG